MGIFKNYLCNNETNSIRQNVLSNQSIGLINLEITSFDTNCLSGLHVFREQGASFF